ncbi:MAG: hypothetical protein CMJ59_16770 [Planctomycetaceae bacterium]|nr:hypothetical protein [Planctomycetaceae bacterium]
MRQSIGGVELAASDPQHGHCGSEGPAIDFLVPVEEVVVLRSPMFFYAGILSQGTGLTTNRSG